jgi:hypothetical protein
MATKKFFFPYGTFSIKDGSEIRYWEDKWLGNATLREQYPSFSNIVRHKDDTIAKRMESSPPNVMLRRNLVLLGLSHGMRRVLGFGSIFSMGW